MPSPRFDGSKPGPGRKKGVPNKSTTEAKPPTDTTKGRKKKPAKPD